MYMNKDIHTIKTATTIALLRVEANFEGGFASALELNVIRTCNCV